MTYRTLDDLDLAGRRVLVRVDINVPVRDDRVTDTTRMEAIRPTVLEILAAGGRPVLLAHFGRPKGKVVAELTLGQLIEPLAEVLGVPVQFSPDCIGPMAERAADRLAGGNALLLENTRFHPGEEANDPAFAQALARLGEVYVNDAFSAAHRAHASTEGLAHLLPAAAGRLMQAELEALERVLSNPERPVIAVIGGAKVSTKLALLGNLIARVDQAVIGGAKVSTKLALLGNLIARVDAIVIGGAMANTFLAARGIDVGKSLCEHDLAETARGIMARAEAAGCELVLPTDVVVARVFEAGAPSAVVAADACPPEAMILDTGPASVADIKARFALARTLVWNGPLGAFEIAPFNAATDAAALAAADLTQAGRLLSVAGGGDTVAALNASGAAARFSYVSTAGGAFLEWLEGKTLPGVAALEAA